MANNASNVAAGKPKVGGAVYRAPAGTAVPTDATTALSNAFICLGYCSEEGMTQSVKRESNKVKAWGGDTVMTVQTSFDETFKIKLIEVLNVDVKKAAFGDDNVTGTLATGITTKVNSKELPEAVWVVETVQNSAVCRQVIPCGKVSELADITYTDGNPIGYDITISALPDATGQASYEYTKAVETE